MWWNWQEDLAPWWWQRANLGKSFIFIVRKVEGREAKLLNEVTISVRLSCHHRLTWDFYHIMQKKNCKSCTRVGIICREPISQTRGRGPWSSHPSPPPPNYACHTYFCIVPVISARGSSIIKSKLKLEPLTNPAKTNWSLWYTIPKA